MHTSRNHANLANAKAMQHAALRCNDAACLHLKMHRTNFGSNSKSQGYWARRFSHQQLILATTSEETAVRITLLFLHHCV